MLYPELNQKLLQKAMQFGRFRDASADSPVSLSSLIISGLMAL